MTIHHLLVALLLCSGVLQAQVTKRQDGIEYSVRSIERKGTSMPYSGGRLTAPEGREIVELKLAVKPVGATTCCEIGKFELETTEGDRAESMWGTFKSEAASTFDLQFLAVPGVRFKTFRVNGVSLDVSKLASEKSLPAGKPNAPATGASQQPGKIDARLRQLLSRQDRAFLLIVRDTAGTYVAVRASDVVLESGGKLTIAQGVYICSAKLEPSEKASDEEIVESLSTNYETPDQGPMFMPLRETGKPWMMGQKGSTKAQRVVVVRAILAPKP
jgi:hypothetical protein